MENKKDPPRDPRDRSIDRPSYDAADMASRKEGGEGSADEISPTDDNAGPRIRDLPSLIN